jgi:hypothetical protein
LFRQPFLFIPAQWRKRRTKEKIRQFLRARVGAAVNSIQLRDAAGIGVSEWARRVRELREDEGWKILTHNDSMDLKPGEYILSEIPPETKARFARNLSPKLKAEVLDRN